MLDEACGVVMSRAGGGRVIQQADHRTRAGLSGEPGQGALARLAGTVKSDNPGIGQRFGQKFLGSTWN
jgi:hypothetical protein